MSVYHTRTDFFFFFFLTVALINSAMIIFKIIFAKYLIESLKVLVWTSINYSRSDCPTWTRRSKMVQHRRRGELKEKYFSTAVSHPQVLLG